MPRFFFDTDDGSRFVIDRKGQELESAEAAKAMAQAALADMVTDAIPDGDRRTFTVSVRDEAGRAVLSTTLSLTSEYAPKPPNSGA
jgi:hypothetical protein